MIDTTDILLIVIILVVGCFLVKKFADKKEGYSDYIYKPKKTSIRYKKNSIPDLNQYFCDVKYHNDYRDVQTAFDRIIPGNKSIFNERGLPVKQVDVVDDSEVKDVVVKFMKLLNGTAKVISDTEFDNMESAWGDSVPDKTVESGYDKVSKAIGQQPSLFGKPAKYHPIKLLAIDNIEKRITKEEIEYICYLIIQKDTVSDQMICKFSYVHMRDLSKLPESQKVHNDLLLEKDGKVELILEQIEIVGYLTKDETNITFSVGDGDLPTDTDGMVDQKFVTKYLYGKFKKQENELMEFKKSVLEENRTLS